ncbi:hypothetical protein O1611_g2777 [Lasiodiplodia mahajangana]|uniref:Uncharacterized protein n=1 Tax=Lasiodiplodia mahajangana TaxID=1108764 RepID=A0ACC2JU48_9PEZI|nr:hypothetical protein O1611_g2777 [Lasiodiplodia mahajangana]
MEPVSTPRISANMLDSYVGQNVIVVGKVMQLRGESALLDANGQVTALLNPESHLMAGNAAQIIGRVNPDLSVKVYNALDLGNNIVGLPDFQVAQSVVEVTHQYKDLFVYDNASSSSVEPESQQHPRSSSPFQPNHRYSHHHHQPSQTPPRPATPASYCSSSSVVYSSSSSLGDGSSPHFDTQLDISPSSQLNTTQGTLSSRLNYQSASRDHLITAESRYSSSSEGFGSTSSLDHELSQLVIEDDEPSYNKPSPSQFTRPASYHSSSSEVFGSTSSLDHGLSQLVIEYDQPPLSQLTVAETHHPWQPNLPRTPPRPDTAGSYCSSSSEVLSSVPDSLDGVFSQPVIEEESPLSSQSTNKKTQSSQSNSQKIKYIESPESSPPATPVREREVPSPVFGSPSSTGKLSTGCPSPVQSPVRSPPSSSTRSPRLYRTRSGNLATVAELRERREREEEFLDIILRGIMVPEDGRMTSRPSVAMRLNESGRWRIDSIQEPWGV